jgi:ABC-type transport system involved in multi-copper enzyme maturation permease subunit
MAGRVFAIAINTFREAIRNKVLYGVMAVVVLANLGAVVLGEMSLHEEARVARDVGLWGVSFFGSATAIALGVSLLYGEIQRKTIHTILAKPIERHEFVLGKYAGMAVTLTILVALFALVLAGLLRLQRVPWGENVTKAVVLGYMEVLVVAAIAVFFSSFSSPFLSGIFTSAIFFLGRVTPDLRYAADKAKEDWIRVISKGALYVLPDLDLYAISGGEVAGEHVTVHGDYVSWAYVGTAGAYAAAWIGVLLVAAALIFRRRDFT